MGDHYYLPTGEMVEGLREARKVSALPSVTTVLRVWPQDGLKKWLRGQDILSAATTPRLPDESDEEWTERVIAGADEESLRARNTGTRRHTIIEDYNKGQLKLGHHDPRDIAHVQPYITWFQANVRKVRYAERIVVNKELGYAGTLDLDCILQNNEQPQYADPQVAGLMRTGLGTPVRYPVALIDVKNRKRLDTYSTDCFQLVAYSRCDDCRADKLISIVLGTERQEILIKEWTLEEIDRAWKNFKLCLDLWCASRDYYPTKGAQ